MAQVVTSENLVEFITTGKVPEFTQPQPPAANQAATNGAGPTKETPKTNGESKGADQAASAQNGAAGASQARDASGKFIVADKAASDAAVDDPRHEGFGADLPERVRKQMGRKHAAMKEAEEFATAEGRRAIRAEQRAEELQRQLNERGANPSASTASSPESSPDDKEPDPTKFQTVGEYAKAVTQYEVRKAAKEARANAAQASAQANEQAEANRIGSEWNARQAKFKETHADYEQVLEDCEVEIPNAAVQCLAEIESGPALAYWLAQPENQHHLKHLRTLQSPRAIARELGKLEAKLDAQNAAAQQSEQTQQGGNSQSPQAPATAGNARQVSKAPPPIEPLANTESSATATHKDPATMSFQELRAFRMAEAAKRGRQE